MSKYRWTSLFAPVVAVVACGRAPPSPARPTPLAPAKAAVVTPPASAPARAAPPWGDAARLAAAIDGYVAGFGKQWGEAYAPSGVLVVAQDGAPIVTRAWGFADRERRVAPDERSRFRIGSVTKQFTAACVLQLVEQGKLSLDDPLKKLFPDWPSPAGDHVTVHRLLTHTSGIPSYTDDRALQKERDKPHTHDAIVARFRDLPLHFEPGTRFEYSNSNYFLLGMIVEKLSGERYEEYVAKHVFAPAAMRGATAGEVPGAPGDALGYEVDDEERIVPAHAIDMSMPFAAGEVRASALDLVAWDRALVGTSVLSEASKRKMLTPEKESYGYGVEVRRAHGHDVMGHDGGIDGFSANFLRVPDLGLAIVVLGNVETFHTGALAKAVLEAALTGKGPPPRAEAIVVPWAAGELDALAGTYVMDAASRTKIADELPQGALDDLGQVALAVEGDRLFFVPQKHGRLLLFRGQDGALFMKAAEFRLAPDAPTGGKVAGFTWTYDALHARFVRR